MYRGGISPADIARHPPVYRKVPEVCHSLWVNACRIILSRYKKESIAENSDGMCAAVLAFLQLPSEVLTYSSSFSGKRKVSLVQKKREDVIERSTYFFRRHPNISENSQQVRLSHEKSQVVEDEDRTDKDVERADERTIRKCRSLIRDGHVARAAKTLLQTHL